MTHRYTATFTSTARIIDPSEQDRFIAKASLEPLRGLLPEGVNPADNPDLLYISGNGAVASVANLNDDCITAETALRIYKTCAAKYINLDHQRSSVVGAVLYPGLTRYGTNEPITEAEAAALKEPFNIAFAGVIWKLVRPEVSRYIARDNGATDEGALSLSWEIGFSVFSIAVAPEGTRNIFDSRIVTAADPEFEALSKKLRSNGGKGKSDDGESLYRLITGDAIILGYSIVSRPAAAVKGILPITAAPAAPAPTPEPPAAAPEKPAPVAVPANVETTPVETPATQSPLTSNPAVVTPEVAPSKAAPEENFITTANSRVTSNTALNAQVLPPPIMKLESLDQLTAQWTEVRKMESAAAVTDLLQDAINKGNAEWEQKVTAEKNLVQTLQTSKAEIEKAKEDAEKRAKELEASLAQVQKQVDELKSAQATAAANLKFQERMASMDEQFELDDEDRQIIASDIREMSDEAFTAYAKKQGKLMAAKKKGKGQMPPEMVKKMEEKKEKECKAAEAFASVTVINDQPVIPNTATVVTADLKDQMDEAFGETIKIDGKSVKTRRAEKVAKQPKE